MNNQSFEEEIDGRFKGINNFPGKIIKGTLNEAPIKIKVSSIPAKNQNVIYRSFSQPAFGDSTTKFSELSATSKKWNPGPNAYNTQINDSKIYSKKGLGSFASSTKLSRLERTRVHGPGPGTYLKEVHNKNKSNRKAKKQKTTQITSRSYLGDSNVTNTAILSSKIQSRDIFKNQIARAKLVPGPGCYKINPEGTFENQLEQKAAIQNLDVKLKMKKSTSLMNYNFKSKLNRFSEKQKEVPPVGLYEADKHKKQQSTIKYSNNSKQKKKMSIEQKVQKLFSEDQSKRSTKLGPGTYNPKSLGKQKIFTIKESIHDRFGDLKPVYAMAKTMNLQKNREDIFKHNNEHLMRTAINSDVSNNTKYWDNTKGSSSAFKSTTQRNDFVLANKIGPCKYNLDKSIDKKSHLINFRQKWVGV